MYKIYGSAADRCFTAHCIDSANHCRAGGGAGAARRMMVAEDGDEDAALALVVAAMELAAPATDRALSNA